MMPVNAATLTEAIAIRAKSQPDDVIMTFLMAGQKDVQALTYGQLHAEARTMAARLIGAGIHPGEVIVLAVEHDAHLIAGFLASLYVGAIPTIAPYPTAFNQPALYQKRLISVVKHSRARAIIVLPDIRDGLADYLADSPCAVLDLSALTASINASEMVDDPVFTPTPSTPAYIQFSSGTTGSPKGAVVTHGAALQHLHMLASALDLTDKDVLVGWAPFYHDLGLVIYLLLPLASGIPAVTMSPNYWVRRPQVLLRTLHEQRGTICIMPNFGFAHTTRNVRQRDIEGLDLSCVRYLIAGAEVVQPDTMEAFADRFRHTGLSPNAFQVGYGMAECVFMVSLTANDRPPRVDRIARLALLNDHCASPGADADTMAVMSCGVPLPGTTISVLDEQGAPLPEGQVGEVVISSPALFERYLHQPDLTCQTLRQGSCHTGDLGYQVDGELFVVDRKKDLIIVAGKHIYSEPLEQLALSALGDAGGRAAAFGVRSTELGTELPVLVCEVRGQMTD